MSLAASVKSVREAPAWLWEFLGVPPCEEGQSFRLAGHEFLVKDGIPRNRKLLARAETQTRETFGFKWKKRDTFESAASLSRMREWLIERYGNLEKEPWVLEHGDHPLLIDAGCGGGMSTIELLAPLVPAVRYLGIDVSEAVDVARQRFFEHGLEGGFLQADISDLPFGDGSVDLIFSEGVLHHTRSTEESLKSLSRLLRPGGRFLFYVYRRKGPLREFADDYVRAKLQSMNPEEAWRAMEPLTQLGISLGELGAEIDIPRPIDLLGIPAGRISVQRLFYWHVAKVFYRADLSFDEMNHINFDWYAPAFAHRQSPEEVRNWCAEAGLEVEREVIEEAGITVIARKGGGQ